MEGSRPLDWHMGHDSKYLVLLLLVVVQGCISYEAQSYLILTPRRPLCPYYLGIIVPGKHTGCGVRRLWCNSWFHTLLLPPLHISEHKAHLRVSESYFSYLQNHNNTSDPYPTRVVVQRKWGHRYKHFTRCLTQRTQLILVTVKVSTCPCVSMHVHVQYMCRTLRWCSITKEIPGPGIQEFLIKITSISL